MSHTTLIPAYGRDYKSKKAVLQDWNDNKDLMVNDMFHPSDGRYINKTDAQSQPGTYNIRYDRNTKIVPVQV